MTKRAGATFLTIAAIAFALGASGCVGDGEVPTQLSGLIVGTDERPLGPGLVLMEKGPVHAGAYQLGSLIDAKGRFVLEMPSGGTWGIHLFHDDYNYLPLEITIEDHQQVTLTSLDVAVEVWLDLTGKPAWPDQPTDETLVRLPTDDDEADNPVLEDVRMRWEGEMLEITADVHDPSHDLSRMILAYDPTTGGGYALNPPSPADDKGNYPEGTYSMKVFRDERHVPGESVWYFVVSDNLCNNTPILTRTIPPLP